MELLTISEENGSRIFENTEVVQLKYEDDEVKAITKYGYVVTGKIAIVATGYNTKLFTNRTFGTKSTTFNIVTKPVKSFEGWSNKVLIRDNNCLYTHLRAHET